MKNLEQKIQILNQDRGDLPLREHVWLLESFDPQFFRWLFEEDFDNDFDISLTDEQRQEYLNWFNTL
jgi:hypothetical protein